MDAREKAKLLGWNIPKYTTPVKDSFVEIMKNHKELTIKEVEILYYHGCTISSEIFSNNIEISMKERLYRKCKELYDLLMYLENNRRVNIKLSSSSKYGYEEKMFSHNMDINETICKGIHYTLECELEKFLNIAFNKTYIELLYSGEKYSEISLIKNIKELYPNLNEFIAKFEELLEIRPYNLHTIRFFLQILEMDISYFKNIPLELNQFVLDKFSETNEIIYSLIEPKKLGKICHAQIQEIALFLRIDEFLESSSESIEEITLHDWQRRAIFDTLNFFNLYAFTDNDIEKSLGRRFNSFRTLRGMQEEQSLIQKRTQSINSYTKKQKFN